MIHQLQDSLPEMFSVSEVADSLRVNPATVRNWANEGKISFIQRGAQKFFTREAVVNFLKIHNAPNVSKSIN